jgi:hypothetical protein
LDDRTSSSSGVARGNPRAWWSLVCGIASIAVIPAGTLVARESERVELVDSSGSILVAALLGWAAIVLARRAQDRLQITLDRAGGRGVARSGRLLGIIGLLVAGTAALALGFWGLLSLFAE